MIYYFTPKGLKKIKDRLRRLINEITKNPQPEKRAVLENIISKTEEKISQAEVIERKETNGAQIGSVVVIKIDGKESEFNIVGKGEIDPSQGNISYESPLGKSLMGKSKGDTFDILTGEGKKSGEIIEIR